MQQDGRASGRPGAPWSSPTSAPSRRSSRPRGSSSPRRAWTPPELQVTIHGEREQFAARVDFLWRARKVIAEADGLVKYNDRKDLLKERERDHQLREAGYTAVHFTWQELFQTPEAVIARIRSAL